MTEELCERLLRSPAYSHVIAQTSIFRNRPYWAIHHHNASLNGTRCVGWVSETVFCAVAGPTGASTPPIQVIPKAQADGFCAIERN